DAPGKTFRDELFAQYKARINKPFIAKATPLFVRKERLEPAIAAGLTWIGVGLQSGSERVCREVFKRPIPPEEFLRAARLIHSYRLAVYYDVIVDNPLETVEDELATVDVLMRTPMPFFLSLFTLVLYDKAEIREEVLKKCPERIEDPADKDFYVIRPTLLNALKFSAMTVPSFVLKRLVALYRRSPDALTTKILIRSCRALGRFFFQPVAYAALLYRSQRGSLLNTIRVLPYVLDLRFVSIFNIFDTNPDSTEE
ncbi:MAG TPA: radical SAM protein, partial [Candidatus Hydrogenedentes bacterium]|nr:radical SAM protein [Candidatus Hydrogenedentota bacterium]